MPPKECLPKAKCISIHCTNPFSFWHLCDNLEESLKVIITFRTFSKDPPLKSKGPPSYMPNQWGRGRGVVGLIINSAQTFFLLFCPFVQNNTKIGGRWRRFVDHLKSFTIYRYGALHFLAIVLWFKNKTTPFRLFSFDLEIFAKYLLIIFFAILPFLFWSWDIFKIFVGQVFFAIQPKVGKDSFCRLALLCQTGLIYCMRNDMVKHQIISGIFLK